MKKMMTALVALFAFVASANAMSYEQARQQALFLTDKMAYELNLTEEQYEAAYEVNLDYLMGVNTQDDLYGVYWERRNLDLSYILLDWQYQLYLNASYFYRPLYWNAGFWHFGIYARYPHRDYFYFGRPHFYSVYRGGHSWHMNGGHSWYHGRNFAPTGRGRNEHFGMHNRFERGDYGRGSNHGGGGNHYGNNHGGGFHNGNNHGGGNHNGRGFHNGNNHSGDNSHSGFGGHSSNEHNFSTRPGNQESMHNSTIGTRYDRNFGNSRQSSTRSTFGSRSESSSRSQAASPRSTFTPERSTRSEAPSRSFSTPSRSSSSGSSVRSSSSTPSRSFGSSSHSSTPSRSFGSSSHSSSSTRSSSHSSAPSRSFSGSSSHGGSHSGGSHGGGGHFGGRR